MKQTIVKVIGWLHATLLFTLIVPIFYAFSQKRSVSMEQMIYFKGFLIIFPIVATSYAISKMKHFVSYFIISGLIFTITMVCAYYLMKQMPFAAIRLLYLLVLAIETLWLIFDRFMGRLNLKEKEDTKDMLNTDWKPQYNIFEKPGFLLMAYFAVIYVIGLNLDSKTVCNEAFYGAILYFFITVIYQFFEQTKEYLFLNERVLNLPQKRIYGMNRMMMTGFLLLVVVVVMISIFLIPNRSYHDIRKWEMERTITQKVFNEDQKTDTTIQDPMKDLIKKNQKQAKAPIWLEYAADVIGMLVLVFFISILCRAIYRMAKTFRDSYDENGDVIEQIEGISPLRIKTVKRKENKDSRREKVRKQYKKYIRKHKKEAPDPSATPLEIEKEAGVHLLEETNELHALYESARYDDESKEF